MTKSVTKPTAPSNESRQVQAKAEQRRLVWLYLFSFGMIAGVVAVATVVAHWMRPIS